MEDSVETRVPLEPQPHQARLLQVVGMERLGPGEMSSEARPLSMIKLSSDSQYVSNTVKTQEFNCGLHFTLFMILRHVEGL